MIYSASKIFTGDQWLPNCAVITENGMIGDIVPVSSLSSDQKAIHFSDSILAPAFIDLQIYGAYGKLFAVYPETDSLNKLKEYCEQGGAAFCLPTVATNTKEVFYKCIDAVKEYWYKGGEGILGLHLEGPWINPVKRGAHIESLIHTPEAGEVKELLNYGKGVIKMITIAPEICSQEIIDEILSHGIVVSAGHSNASYSEAKSSFTRGVTAVTHLFNAMSPLMHREPGLVGAVMDDEKISASIIPDGYHVDFAAIRIAKKIMKERLFVITDAVTETMEGNYQHHLSGDKYEAAGILSGSALNMGKAVQNLVHFAGIETGETIRMASTYPARVLGLKQLGKIEKGFRSRMVVLDEQLEVKQII